jgi:hypothetical protein
MRQYGLPPSRLTASKRGLSPHRVNYSGTLVAMVVSL